MGHTQKDSLEIPSIQSIADPTALRRVNGSEDVKFLYDGVVEPPDPGLLARLLGYIRALAFASWPAVVPVCKRAYEDYLPPPRSTGNAAAAASTVAGCGATVGTSTTTTTDLPVYPLLNSSVCNHCITS